MRAKFLLFGLLLGATCGGPNTPKVTAYIPACTCNTNEVQLQVVDLGTNEWVDLYLGPPDVTVPMDFSKTPGGPGTFRTRCYDRTDPVKSGVWVEGSSPKPVCP